MNKKNTLSALDDKAKSEFYNLFIDAFLEVHRKTMEYFQASNNYKRYHQDYPRISASLNEFPQFYKVLPFDKDCRIDYTGSILPRGILSILAGEPQQKADLPNLDALIEFCNKNFNQESYSRNHEGTQSRFIHHTVRESLITSVERYIQIYGIESQIENKKILSVTVPVMRGLFEPSLVISLLVPILMTNFDFDRYKLTDSTYICRIPHNLQLSRSRISSFGSGAVDHVAAAATHAFVSTNWHIQNHAVEDIPHSLRQISPDIYEQIDKLFGALRIATGITAGYSQILYIPRKWAIQYFCDLPPAYGTATRRYPSHLDNFGWTEEGEKVYKFQMDKFTHVYRTMMENNNNSIALATKRLNSAVIRSDNVDAILDAIIGLEILLNDNDAQALSYKLRLRAGALVRLHNQPQRSPLETYNTMKELYELRSKIVHGKSKKPTKNLTANQDHSLDHDRMRAIELLKTILLIQLENPQFCDATKIDKLLLLQADGGGAPTAS